MNEEHTPTNTSPAGANNPTNTNDNHSQPIQYGPQGADLPPVKQKTNKKPFIIVAIILIFFTLLISAGAYAYFVYIPSTPEAMLKKAAENLTSEPQSYTVNGRFDNGDPSSPDFDYVLNTDEAGNWNLTVSSFVVAVSPGGEILKKNNTIYVKPTGFLNYKQLAKKYSNYTDNKTEVEYISDFAEYSDIHKWNDKWIEVPTYLYEPSPLLGSSEGQSASFNLDTLSYEVGEVVDEDGKSLQQYKLTIDKDNMKALLETLSGGVVASAFDNYASDNGFSEPISIDVAVDTDTKQFHSLEYDGRPFADATFSFKASQGGVTIDDPVDPTPLVEALDYGVAWSGLIRADMQQGNSERDKERIADLKGMKLALEIYKHKNGVYPDRYSIASERERFLNANLPNVDHELFKDPNGRMVGMNGSQYAYVPEQADSPEPCGDRNYGPCEKFFLATTLDDGTNLQFNSGF